MTDLTLPTIQLSSEYASFTVRCHAVAWADGYGGKAWRYSSEHPGLVLLSATGPDTAIKAIRATLYSPDIPAEFEYRCRTEYGYDDVNHLARATCDGKPVGYQASVAKLGPGAVHLVALAKIPGLMPDMGDDHLWTELSGPRYTTPLLRSWTGYLKRKMIEDGKIVMATGHGVSPGILRIDPQDLDGIVSTGVRWGHLKMQA